MERGPTRVRRYRRDVGVQLHVVPELTARADDAVRADAHPAAEPAVILQHGVRTDGHVLAQRDARADHRGGVDPRPRLGLRIQPLERHGHGQVRILHDHMGPLRRHLTGQVLPHEDQPRPSRRNIPEVSGACKKRELPGARTLDRRHTRDLRIPASQRAADETGDLGCLHGRGADRGSGASLPGGRGAHFEEVASLFRRARTSSVMSSVESAAIRPPADTSKIME